MRVAFLFSIVCIYLVISCNYSWNSVEGEGPVVSDSRSLTGFDEIELNSSADIYFQQHEKYKVVVETNENLLDHIITSMDETKLTIDTKDGSSISSDDGIKIFIFGPELSNLVINGSGSFFAEDPIKTDNLKCEISGSGDINFKKLVCDSYSMNINGSGDITLAAGSSNRADFTISGSGEIYASHSKIKNLEIEINGSGTAEVYVTKNLTGSLIGSGDIYFKGNPKEDIEINGSGDVEKL